MMNQEPRLHSSYLQSLGKKGNKSKQMQIKASNITKSVTPYNPVAQPADMLLQICFLPYSILSHYTGTYPSSSSPPNKLSSKQALLEQRYRI